MAPETQILPRWFRAMAVVGAALSLLAAALIVWQAGLPESDDEPVGPVRPFVAQTIDGQTLTVDSSLNHPLILNFWATWCVPCTIEMPRLEQAFQEYHEQGFVVIGVNAGHEDPRDVIAFAIIHDLSFPLVMDPDGTIEQLYEVRGVLPTTVFVDADGQIQDIVYGIVTEDVLEDGLRDIGVTW